MAKTLRKGLVKKTKKKSTLMFDFLDDITYHKTNILTSENVHGYSKYMITRFLSMNRAFIPIVDTILNRFQDVLDPYEFHTLCIGLFPKKKLFLKYIKGSPLKKKSVDQVRYIKDYFKISEDEAFDYYQIAGDELVRNIKIMYGIRE